MFFGPVWRLLHPFILALLVSAGAAVAYPGQVDPTFVGSRTGFFGGTAMAVQTDGKILFGSASPGTANFTPVPTVYRVNADGTLDSTFHAPTVSWFSGILCLALDPDGKIMVGGSFSVLGANPLLLGIARLNPDGSLDPTFQLVTGSRNVSGNSVSSSSVNSIIRRPDGKYLVAGNFNTCAGVATNHLVCLNADGSRDGSFQVGTGFNASVNSLALQADGKLTVGGYFSSYNGTAAGRIVRLNADGTRDTAFNTGAGFDAGVMQVAAAPNGAVLVRGSFSNFNGAAAPPLMRLLATGARDTTLVNNSITRVSDLVVEPDGRILVSGERAPSYTIPTLMRLESDGTLSPGFTPPTSSGLVGTDLTSVQEVNGFIYARARSAVNGKVRQGVAVFDQRGGLQAAFRPNGPSAPTGLTLEPDGNFLALASGGSTFDEQDFLLLFEVGSDGHFIRKINLGINVQGFSLQSDGKVLVAFAGVLRLNADFTNDSTFTYGGPAGLSFNQITQLPDGKILCAGGGSYDGTNTLLRLNSNGSRDTSFAAVTLPANSSISSFRVQPDGKVLINGPFLSVNGSPRPQLARLNADGTLDQSFVPSGYAGFGSAMAVQPDGKIIISGGGWGDRSDVDGWPVLPGIARLLPDGSLDPSFQPLLGTDSDVRAVVIQPDGRLIIGGGFRTFNGVPRGFLARVEPDGTLDSSFDGGPALTNAPTGYLAVNQLILQPDGKLIVNGTFPSIGGEYTPYMARIETTGAAPAPVISSPSAVAVVRDEDTSYSVDFTATEPNGEAVTWSASTPLLGSVTLAATGNTVHVTYTPGPDKNGRENVAIIARNSAGFEDSAVFQVLITPINDPPVMRAAPALTLAPLVGVQLSPSAGYFDDSKDSTDPWKTSVTLSYQWQVADDANGSNTADIAGATDLKFTPTLGLTGNFIRLRVTASDSGIGLPAVQSTTASTGWAMVHQRATMGAWATAKFGADVGNPLISSANADPDGDGLPNLFEYFLGTAPLTRESSRNRITVSVEASGYGGYADKFLTLTYRYAPEAQDVTVGFEASNDLIYWSAVSLDEVSRQNNADGTVTVKARDPYPTWLYPMRYLRLKLSLQ